MYYDTRYNFYGKKEDVEKFKEQLIYWNLEGSKETDVWTSNMYMHNIMIGANQDARKKAMNFLNLSSITVCKYDYIYIMDEIKTGPEGYCALELFIYSESSNLILETVFKKLLLLINLDDILKIAWMVLDTDDPFGYSYRDPNEIDEFCPIDNVPKYMLQFNFCEDECLAVSDKDLIDAYERFVTEGEHLYKYWTSLNDTVKTKNYVLKLPDIEEFLDAVFNIKDEQFFTSKLSKAISYKFKNPGSYIRIIRIKPEL